jgi:uncharacterized phiE125 gp8 family phage protein
MALTVVQPPAVEPVSLADAKAFCRIDTPYDDALVESLIITSRLQIETALGLALISQTLRRSVGHWPDCGTIEFRVRPVQSIGSVTVVGASGAVEPLDPSTYRGDLASPTPRVVLLVSPTAAFTALPGSLAVSFVAGFGATPDTVPPPVRHALRLLIAHWYDNRDGAAVGGAAIPAAVSELLGPYREGRL